jgi:hypothetical protein
MKRALVVVICGLWAAYWFFAAGQAAAVAYRRNPALVGGRLFTELFPQRWAFFCPVLEEQFRIVYEFSSSTDTSIPPVVIDVTEPQLRSRMRFRSVRETLVDSILMSFTMRFLGDVAKYHGTSWTQLSDKKQAIYSHIVAHRNAYQCLSAMLEYGVRVKHEMKIPDSCNQIRLVVIVCRVPRFESLPQPTPADRIVDISEGQVLFDSSPILLENL